MLVPGFNIAGLLPANLKLYFHYNGSLTTPPCYQTVKWTIFNQTVLLSHHQVCEGNELRTGSFPACPRTLVQLPCASALQLIWLPKAGWCYSVHIVLLPDVNAGFKPENR